MGYYAEPRTFDVRNTPLSVLVKQWKGTAAHQVNQSLNRRGTFWQKGYFDTLIRLFYTLFVFITACGLKSALHQARGLQSAGTPQLLALLDFGSVF